MTSRLNSATKDSFTASQKPNYDRASVKSGIVHLGIGAFHRAHQAVYTDDCLNVGDLRWGIIGASLRSPSVAQQLNPQDGLYHVETRFNDEKSHRLIGACQKVLVAPQDPRALVSALANPDVTVVTLTITEKGYLLDPASGDLVDNDADLAHDRAHIATPRTALGFLVSALRERKSSNAGPMTLVSCDNLPHNGARLKKAVCQLASEIDGDLGKWIADDISFPATMVDRIVPATTPEDLAGFEALSGLNDEGLVKAEPFSQWVIEDDFCAARPKWEDAGAQLTKDVKSYEWVKLRLLNGAHSAIAYLGALAGYQFVHEAMQDQDLRRFVMSLHDEAEKTLTIPAGMDIGAYRHQLIERFDNAALNHKTRQIAMDGSQKLPQRLVMAFEERLKAGLDSPALALGIAAWIRWQAGKDEQGQDFVVDDPLAVKTRTLYDQAINTDDKIRAFLSLEPVFGTALKDNEKALTQLKAAFETISQKGSKASLNSFRK